MKEPAKILRQKLKNAERIAVLGIGSDLRGDDIAGIAAVEQTERLFKSSESSPEVKFFIGATAPENLTGEIKKFQPTHLIIIDSVHSEGPAGEIVVMEPPQIEEVSFFTHKLPVKVMIDYLLQFCKCSVIIIGIVPKNIGFGVAVSKEVSAAVEKLGKIIVEAICG